MTRVNHIHYVAPLPGEPDLFEPPAVFTPNWGAESPCPIGIGDAAWFAAPAQPVDTSLAAAAKITKHTARIREAIYLYIRACGGATAGEIATECGLNPSTVRPRLLELQGRAKWAPGLPVRIQRSPEIRQHMHIYVALSGGS